MVTSLKNVLLGELKKEISFYLYDLFKTDRKKYLLIVSLQILVDSGRNSWQRQTIASHNLIHLELREIFSLDPHWIVNIQN